MNIGFPGVASGKELVCQYRKHEMWVRSLCQEDPPEEGMEKHSSILTWIILMTEEPGWLQSIGSKELGMTKVT